MRAPDMALVTSPTRLAELDALSVLDTPSEEGFDDLAQVAALVCAAPVALVSLVSKDRQWFKARVGFAPCETDLAASVCAHALSEPDLLVVPDLTLDPRTRDNPLVTGDPFIRFYAGAPLRMESGNVVGSFCVIDTAPRPEGLTADQKDILRRLARQVVALLRERKHSQHVTVSEERLRIALERQRALTRLGDTLRDVNDGAAMLTAAAELVGRTFGASRAGYADLDESGEFADVLGSWTPRGWNSATRRHRFADYSLDFAPVLRRGEALVVSDVETDPLTRTEAAHFRQLRIGSLLNVPLKERGRTVGLIFVHDTHPRSWMPDEIAFVRTVADRIQVALARVRAEEHQRTLNAELSHRMKNVLAMVQAIALQTLRNAPDLDAARRALEARLATMGRAHDVLLAGRMEATSLRDVVQSALTVGDPDRFRLEGPSVVVGSKAALSLALLFHELVTNAMKYGALSSPAGTVSIEWTVECEASKPAVHMRWTETGGPPVAAPTRRGFGSRLIERALDGVLGGNVTTAYLPSGFVCELVASVAGLQAES